jgi:hypothetical protein
MDKIRELLKQLGASDECSTAILSEMNSFKKRTEAHSDRLFEERLEKAKQICLEEYEKEVIKLAKKVEIFLEARVSTIDREARKQAAIGESEATKTLRELKHLLEGVPIDGHAKEIQAAKGQTRALKVKLDKVLGENRSLQEQVRKTNTIAMKVLKRNRILESKRDGSVTESRKSAKKVRLESLRTKSQTPNTNRKVLTESQVPAKQVKQETGDPEILKIANKVDETPAYIGG